jgi:hypothetical protein
MPEIAPRYVGYVAWRGVVEESQIPLHWRTQTLNDIQRYGVLPASR